MIIPWNKNDNIRLIEYIANCHPNELPDQKEMQRLLKECLEIKGETK